MKTEAEVVGSAVILRLVVEDDAEFIWGLRNNPTYNSHLSTTRGTAEDQRRWIRDYKTREAAGSEYYFIIERHDDRRKCGTVRIYDIRDGQFTWGSWILDENKPRKAALDSALQVYRFGFETLGSVKSIFDVRKDNTHTLKFHDRFGAARTHEDHENIYFILTKAHFRAVASRYADVFP